MTRTSAEAIETYPPAPYAQFAIRFAEALVARNFDMAHAMLSTSLRKATRVEQLRESYDMMMQRGDSTPPITELISTLDDWPTRRKSDLGWAYVAISGTSYAEGIAVIVKQVSGQPVIRQIEWGRP